MSIEEGLPDMLNLMYTSSLLTAFTNVLIPILLYMIWVEIRGVNTWQLPQKNVSNPPSKRGWMPTDSITSLPRQGPIPYTVSPILSSVPKGDSSVSSVKRRAVKKKPRRTKKNI